MTIIQNNMTIHNHHLDNWIVFAFSDPFQDLCLVQHGPTFQLHRPWSFNIRQASMILFSLQDSCRDFLHQNQTTKLQNTQRKEGTIISKYNNVTMLTVSVVESIDN